MLPASPATGREALCCLIALQIRHKRLARRRSRSNLTKSLRVEWFPHTEKKVFLSN
jgi:hypothetical protein